CYVFLTTVTLNYVVLLKPAMTFYASLLGPLGRAQLVPIAVFLGCFAMLHFPKLLAMVWCSIRARELVFSLQALEIGSQVYQVHSSSSDLTLDFGSSVLVPALIFAPFVAAFDYEIVDVPLALLYDEVWFSRMMFAAQREFATSLLDTAFTLLPHVGICVALSSLVALMRRGCPWRRRQQQQRSEQRAVAVSSSSARSSAPVTVLFVISGVAVGFVHVWSSLAPVLLAPDNPSCELCLQPWFVTEHACSVFHYNCYRRNTSIVPEAALDGFDPSELAIFVVSYCPALAVPAHVAKFRNLLGLELYNCTLVKWDASTTIREHVHHPLQVVILAHVNMTELPAGLRQPLPPSLHDIAIVKSNLTKLPTDLHLAWRHQLSVLFLEHNAFRAVPLTLAHIRARELSLIGCRIETVDAYADADPAVLDMLVDLTLSDVPLHTLMDWSGRVGALTSLQQLAIEHMALKWLPDWLLALAASGAAPEVFARDTPFCDRESVAAAEAAMCARRHVAPLGKYPLAAMATLRLS
ncbi:hypothetical protein PybrP1_009542, partial [[Pythium] brassicae (nom. inval.)]